MHRSPTANFIHAFQVLAFAYGETGFVYSGLRQKIIRILKKRAQLRKSAKALIELLGSYNPSTIYPQHQADPTCPVPVSDLYTTRDPCDVFVHWDRLYKKRKETSLYIKHILGKLNPKRREYIKLIKIFLTDSNQYSLTRSGYSANAGKIVFNFEDTVWTINMKTTEEYDPMFPYK